MSDMRLTERVKSLAQRERQQARIEELERELAEARKGISMSVKMAAQNALSAANLRAELEKMTEHRDILGDQFEAQVQLTRANRIERDQWREVAEKMYWHCFNPEIEQLFIKLKETNP